MEPGRVHRRVAGLAVSMWVVRWGQAGKGMERSEQKPLLLALSAYIVLVLFTVVILLIPSVKEWLGQVSIQIQFPETVHRWAISVQQVRTAPFGFLHMLVRY